MFSERITFTGHDGSELSGRLELPPQSPIAYAIFAHCFTCSKNLNASRHISEALVRAGIAVLRFDFTGLGQSGGEFAQTNFSSNVQDLVLAAQYLEAHHSAPQLLVGHSLGGAAVLQAQQHIPSIKAVATLGAPCDPKHVSHLLQDSLEEIEATGKARVQLGGREFTIAKQFLTDLQNVAQEDAIRQSRAALLIMHAPFDMVVNIDNAARIYNLAKHPKSFITLDKADHLLNVEDDACYVGQVIATWVSRYLTQPPRMQSWYTDVPRRAIAVRTEQGYRSEVYGNGHFFIADEPVKLGGTGTGPNPFDYLYAALGSCTTITVRMYADRKGWALEAVEATITMTQEKTANGQLKSIFTRDLQLIGDLSDEERKRLLAVANRCPVHRALEGEVEVITRLAEPQTP